VKEIRLIANDFDDSKPMAAIETAKTVSAMHLAKAKNAAVSGDRQTLETELKEATEIWPRNPALAEVAGLIFSQGDQQGKALMDLDQLISQHNYRQIYDDKMRFIAAAALDPARQEQLRKILENMEKIEGAIMQADARSKQGDYAGAWENVEKAFKDFPDDTKLNNLRATLTTEAPDFVHTLRNAQELEDKDQVGSSLAWYLKAQKIYPNSEFAQDGIDRMVKKILPQG
jgi:tetratricopeptide (TPR) repeat protein